MQIQRTVKILLIAVALLLPSFAQGQEQAAPKGHDQSGMAGMDMDDARREAARNPEAARAANDAMSGSMDGDMSEHDMAMHAHMFMTDLRPENPADEKRAAEIVAELRPAIEKYRDYRVALADGFQIFFPNVPQPHYHFTNYRYAFEAQFAFNPSHPTSLLYKKTSDGYELEGAMYTAPKRATEEVLNERVPLSVAHWHKHVNFCMPQKGALWQQVDWKEFGLRGSITTEAACEQAGGVWKPQIFGWMVHVYPYQTDPAKIWAH
ncbi:MAG: hypothetical protein ACRD59_18990 [Candidatus Acidiferrales bacterium]